MPAASFGWPWHRIAVPRRDSAFPPSFSGPSTGWGYCPSPLPTDSAALHTWRGKNWMRTSPRAGGGTTSTPGSWTGSPRGSGRRPVSICGRMRRPSSGSRKPRRRRSASSPHERRRRSTRRANEPLPLCPVHRCKACNVREYQGASRSLQESNHPGRICQKMGTATLHGNVLCRWHQDLL